jgi:hypothetical protein
VVADRQGGEHQGGMIPISVAGQLVTIQCPERTEAVERSGRQTG